MSFVDCTSRKWDRSCGNQDGAARYQQLLSKDDGERGTYDTRSLLLKPVDEPELERRRESERQLSKEEVAHWLVVAGDKDLKAVLSSIARNRPDIMEAAVGLVDTAEKHAEWLRSSDSNDVIWALSWMAQERPELLKKVSSKLPVTLEERTKVFTSGSDEHIVSMLQRLAADRPDLLRRAGAGAPVTPEEHTSWLLRAEEMEVKKALERLVGERPDLVRQAWTDRRAQLPEPPVAVEPNLEQVPGRTGLNTVMQFSCPIYYAEEGEHTVDIEVLRIGDVNGHSEVKYTTREGSAKAGRIYTHTEGILMFEPGDTRLSVQIPLLDNDQWDTTLDFGIALCDEGLMNADLAKSSWQARIYILDNDAFPTNKFATEIREGMIGQVSHPQLLIEYFKLCWSNEKIRMRTRYSMMYDQLHNVYFVVGLFANVVLVDFALNPDADVSLMPFGNRHATLVLLVLTNVLPNIILHLLDLRKILIYGPAGACRRMVMVALIRRYLNLSSEVRVDLSPGKFFMAVSRDAVSLADDGYSNIIQVFKSFGALLATLFYMCMGPIVFDEPFSMVPVYFFLLFPVMMLGFLLARMKVTTEYLRIKNEKQDEVVSFADQTMAAYALIRDYNQRSQVSERFETLIQEYNKSKREEGQVYFNNKYFAEFLILVAVGGLTLLSGPGVIDGTQSLGMFLTNVRLITQIGKAWGHIYSSLNHMQVSFHGLENVTEFLNMPTDIPSRMQLQRHLVEQSNAMQSQMSESGVARGLVADYLPISLEGIEMHYRNGSMAGDPQTPSNHKTSMNYRGRIDIMQGQLVAFTGHHGEGKSTILRIIGGLIFPDQGGVFFVPPHLRLLHVSSQPMFLDGSLMTNLRLGVGNLGDEGKKERVLTICRRLGLSEEVLALIDSQEIHNWEKVLSAAQCQKLSLACALIANPEVLIIHRPTQVFGEHTSRMVLQLLREFVTNRGLEEDPSTVQGRRPRTCIFSTEKRNMTKAGDVDIVYHVGLEFGIRRVETGKVSDKMFG